LARRIKYKLYTKSQVDEIVNQANKLDKACKDEEYRKVLKENKNKDWVLMSVKDLLLARDCLKFTGKYCNNEDCINNSCPLNKYWEKKMWVGRK